MQAFGTVRRPGDVPAQTDSGKPVLVAYTPRERQIKEMALEAAAARGVLNEANELARDGVARKEARHRSEATTQQLLDYLDELYAPESPDVVWFVCGREASVGSYRELSQAISKACDKTYRSCPKIGNEMINCDRLSSAAARAQRELAEAMVEGCNEERLGLEGFGPEVAVYLSLFEANGLHRKGRDGQWRFLPPSKSHAAFQAVWTRLTELVAEAGHEGIGADELVECLCLPPFGLRKGPIPLLLTWFLLSRPDEVALFREGAYVPVIDPADIALLVKRPELFTIREFAPEGIRQEVFEVYRRIIETDA